MPHAVNVLKLCVGYLWVVFAQLSCLVADICTFVFVLVSISIVWSCHALAALRRVARLCDVTSCPPAQQQLDFLLLRRQQFMRAALRSKQMKDMQGAALHLRHAKGLDPMINAAKGGLPVDITKVTRVLVISHPSRCGVPIGPREGSVSQMETDMEILIKAPEGLVTS